MQNTKINSIKLYEHAVRLFEIAKEYRDHMVMAAGMDEDMSLADEIDTIQKDVEGPQL